MTRWARANNSLRKKVLDATPWEEMEQGSSRSGKRGNSQKGKLHGRRTHSSQKLSLKKSDPHPAKNKKSKKRKDHLSEDVNGFMDYLKQTAQDIQNGKVEGAASEEVMEEISTLLKKDQRRDNRRLKRQVKKKNQMLCFHCRKPGHGLADCSEAHRSQEMGTGICYRCGSTEHELNKCRAKVDPALGEFPYAQCFICGEMGHLSRSCPDNPKGLYAEGGCCKVCGSVEHFQRDCPEHRNSGQITVGRWFSGMSADHEEIPEAARMQSLKKKVPKVVKF
ncbi:zinc finger CCHC domain-containing protein 9 [Rhinatrema bivittatum]|uniref:zinc finger CCHC domain-containing protein 9 n=1 Tax=Rhinatrema bivittatum TaxID=194408 RepID=UPI00112DBA9C|nr:zinc finger CCHC domain-containing protein 9 [Rhinatrema bivittatum]XP_029429948.1 zinc finger CCHC domain-containing protein 9 [Rhinatrema bivittatum]XP_029429955.1 zinc finger CCHC domain-containing protein 9 [Rhinatrema bivittatum]XP_029429965.1 zinc finger CCHC domain-containing protein 9 [Rhinatrema bivittatum]XP_029429973.1 zinc finger CCHC domain-containing protein 9 [Rhinatrema bivittatum]XP_029429976.1 zinc finger CCHC domain-containing protein 9 [Rhinatrema bivittatum]XP_02942998